MPKTMYTPRDELVCGKIDHVESLVSQISDDALAVEIMDYMRSIRHDCHRMEAKLISREADATQANMK